MPLNFPQDMIFTNTLLQIDYRIEKLILNLRLMTHHNVNAPLKFNYRYFSRYHRSNQALLKGLRVFTNKNTT
jgi:hypothetical protein